MTFYGLASLALMGLSINLLVNGYTLVSLFISSITTSFLMYKYHKTIQEFDCLKVGIYTLGLWILWIVSGLIYVFPYFSIEAIIISVYMVIFEKMIHYYMNQSLMICDQLIYILTILFIGFMMITFAMPKDVIKYFLYPNFIDGGSKYAIMVILWTIFMPYPILIKATQFSRLKSSSRCEKYDTIYQKVMVEYEKNHTMDL